MYKNITQSLYIRHLAMCASSNSWACMRTSVCVRVFSFVYIALCSIVFDNCAGLQLLTERNVQINAQHRIINRSEYFSYWNWDLFCSEYFSFWLFHVSTNYFHLERMSMEKWPKHRTKPFYDLTSNGKCSLFKLTQCNICQANWMNG